MIINLYEHIGLSIIVPFKTGVIYSSQVGGTANFIKKEEGFIIPYANDSDPYDYESSLEFALMSAFKDFHDDSIDENLAQNINQLFSQSSYFDGIVIDADKLSNSCEGWIYLKIDFSKNNILPSLINEYQFVEAILVWPNSD